MKVENRYFFGIAFFLACSFLPVDVNAQEDEYYDEVTTESDQSLFDSIYYLPGEVEVRSISDSAKARMLSDEDYWYVNLTPPRAQKKSPEKIKKDPSVFQRNWFKNLVWIILISVFISAVIWFLANSNISLFSSKKPIIADEDAPITEEDLFSTDFEKQIQKAEAENDFRLATRLWFLHTIKLLSENNLIQYLPETTNTQYLDQLFSSNYYKQFFSITRKFEYIWYGKFEPSEAQYAQIKTEFQSFKSRLGS